MFDIVVIGAGLAGVATAHSLAFDHGRTNVAVVDPRPPLTLTSDKSTECYRNWWPNRPMFDLMARSIERLEQFHLDSDGAFSMNRTGYLFATAEPATLARLTRAAESIESWGGGPVAHPGRDLQMPSGTDVWEGLDLRRAFPALTRRAVGAVHARRAGWLSAQQLGAWMIDRCTGAGVSFLRDEVVAIDTRRDEVTGVHLRRGGGVRARTVVNAGGPFLASIARMVDVELPIFSELHLKVAFRDRAGAIPRTSPMMIWCDPQTVSWSADERRGLSDLGRPELTAELPAMCHGRPEGGAESAWVLALWEYERRVMEPVWPLPIDELYPEVVLRGMARMIPGLTVYQDRLPAPIVDGGYYTRTCDNRPLVGRVGPAGFVVAGAMGGFGVMASAVVGELAASSAVGIEAGPLAVHADPARFDDPGYRPTDEDDGQL